MTLRNFGLALAAELILLLLLAGTTLMKVADTIRIPTVQIVSISQPGAKLKPAAAAEPAKAKAHEAVKPSPNPGIKKASDRSGAPGAKTGTEPTSYPGDRANPSPQSLLSVVYPKEAQNEEWEGQVVIEVAVDKNGRATGSKIVQSSGHPVLDAAFAQSALKMTFKPKREKGVDVAGTVVLRHNFKLD